MNYLQMNLFDVQKSGSASRICFIVTSKPPICSQSIHETNWRNEQSKSLAASLLETVKGNFSEVQAYFRLPFFNCNYFIPTSESRRFSAHQVPIIICFPRLDKLGTILIYRK
jgi:hypothetical protein